MVKNKMDMARVFSTFSRRSEPLQEASKPLTPEFRNRVLQLCTTTFPLYEQTYAMTLKPILSDLWSDIRQKLLYLHGRQTLSNRPTYDQGSEITGFLAGCSDEHFLDFIEFVFQSYLIWGAHDSRTGHQVNPHALIDDVNIFMEVDNLPYYLTGFTITDNNIAAYPQIIRRDSDIIHESAIKPTLALLSHPIFASANGEFLDALKDFRSGDYRDCVAKCGSSLESVMKVICDRKGWPYQQNDTTGPLLKHILPQTALGSYFEQPIMLIATIRNRLSTAHGAGTQQKTVPRHVANYVINSTAATILLLVGETND